MVQVGAFLEASSVQGLSSNTEARTVSTTQDSTPILALNARVVDEEEPPLPVPIFEPPANLTETQLLKALLQRRKCRIILAVAVMFGVGLIVAVVLLALVVLTQNGSNSMYKEIPSKLFLADLKSLLSSQSLSALDNPDSPQSQSLQWLLEKSNFEDWSFQRQVQRFAMATIYYATGGPSWSNDAGGNKWLTNATECGWSQGDSQGNFCSKNDALVSLYQASNALRGTIPDEIGLLTSLNVINLGGNTLSGTVPSQLGSLTALTWLDLSSNDFGGTVPSELGSLTALTSLSLDTNSFTGTVPSQLGSLTALTVLELYDNVGLNGTVPAKLCNLGTVSIFVGCAPGPECSCCTCF